MSSSVFNYDSRKCCQ